MKAAAPTPRADKYIVLLADADPNTKSAVDAPAAKLAAVSEALDQPLLNSAELGGELSADEVYDRGQGIFFKNLNVVVVDDLDLDLAAAAVQGSSPVIHVERERVYYALDTETVTELDPRVLTEVDALRQNLLAMQERLEGLDELLRAAPQPEDPRFNRGGAMTWGLRAVGWSLAGPWTGAGARVAVLDTGIDPGHPSFSESGLIGKTFVTEAWDEDRNGHGTHCAGTVAGGRMTGGRTADDAQEAFGVAPGADLLIGRVLSDAGSGSTSGIVDAIDWALEKGAHVVSMSLGSAVRIGEAPSPVFERVGERALAQGCLLVAAAGNASRRPQSPPQPVGNPANAQSIMAVGALDERLRVASFSNGGINAGDGGAIDVAAPGVAVRSAESTLTDTAAPYSSKSGTSMATPHVAGIAALLLEQDPSRTGAALWGALTALAKPLPGALVRDVGAGLAQCPRA